MDLGVADRDAGDVQVRREQRDRAELLVLVPERRRRSGRAPLLAISVVPGERQRVVVGRQHDARVVHRVVDQVVLDRVAVAAVDRDAVRPPRQLDGVVDEVVVVARCRPTWSFTYLLAQTASASSPVVRNDELNTRELRVPLVKLMPSA